MYWDGSGKEENGNYFQKLPMYQAPARNIELHEFRSLNHRRCLINKFVTGLVYNYKNFREWCKFYYNLRIE